MDMASNIKAVENMVKIAVNVKPKNRVRTKETRAETMQILSDMVAEIQKSLIGYECLKAAVMKSKDNEKISADTQELIAEYINKLTTEKE